MSIYWLDINLVSSDFLLKNNDGGQYAYLVFLDLKKAKFDKPINSALDALSTWYTRFNVAQV